MKIIRTQSNPNEEEKPNLIETQNLFKEDNQTLQTFDEIDQTPIDIPSDDFLEIQNPE